MRRALVAAALVVSSALVSLAPASAHGDYSGGWTDPAPGAELDGLRGISGSVGHAHGIEAIALTVVEPAEAAPDSCAAGGGPWAPISGGGEQQVSFTFQVVFPCNIVYRVQASAQAGAGEGSTFDPDPAPGPFQMAARIAVAIPAEPVEDLRLRLTGDGERDGWDVTVSWADGLEPDIERYVVLRDGEAIGEVDESDDLVLVDEDPPQGVRTTYDVVAIRSGPNGDVTGRPASGAITPPAPEDEDEDANDDDGDGDGDGDDPDDDGAAGGGGSTSGGTGGSGGGGQPAPSVAPSRPVSGGPPTTADTGFSETLPFGETPVDEVAAAPPASDGSVVAAFDDGDDAPILNQETWTFIAAGLALLMGSMVIRHVTRRAAAGY